MKEVFFCSAFRNDKVYEMRILHSANEVNIYIAECKTKGLSVEYAKLSSGENTVQEKREVQYVPPPKWGGRVICVETGWIFKSISAAARSMNGSQWALRKAVIRNTVYHRFHWRMYGDVEKKIDKFT